MDKEFQTFARTLGELLIAEAADPNYTDPQKGAIIQAFQAKHNIPQIFSREMLKHCQKKVIVRKVQ